jgi:hypothetical protein
VGSNILVVEEIVFVFEGGVDVVPESADVAFDEGSMTITTVLMDVTVTAVGLVAVVLSAGEVD